MESKSGYMQAQEKGPITRTELSASVRVLGDVAQVYGASNRGHCLGIKWKREDQVVSG